MRYIVPAGTTICTAEDGLRRHWRPHTTRRALLFQEYRIRDVHEYVFAYRGRLLRVDRSKVQVQAEQGVTTYSLIFSLVTTPPEMRDLVVQLDQHAESEFTKPADPSKTLLDVQVADRHLVGQMPADDGRFLVVAKVPPLLTFIRVAHGMGLRKSYANSYRPSFQFQERQDPSYTGCFKYFGR
jgi:hypothetical protein